MLPDNNRIPWRSDSFILDRGPMQEDLSKGNLCWKQYTRQIIISEHFMQPVSYYSK